MEDAFGIGFWLFLSIYLILSFMAFWLIHDRETRKECLSRLWRGFTLIVMLWILAIVGIGILVAVLAAAF